MAFDLLDLGGFAELLDWLRGALAGWRYLFSSSYRQQIHSGWKSDRWYYIAWDVVCGVAGLAFSLFLLYLVVSLFAGLDWPARLFYGTSTV
jgi:hypothetical protein